MLVVAEEHTAVSSNRRGRVEWCRRQWLETLTGALLVAALVLAPAWSVRAQQSAEVSGIDTPDPEEQRQHAVDQLSEIRSTLTRKRQEIERLKKARQVADEIDAQELDQQLVELRAEVEALNRSFEKVAVGGVDLERLSAADEEAFDWRQELVLITRPLIATLKDVTEKPRKIEELRARISLYDLQLQTIKRAMVSIAMIEQGPLSPGVAEGMGEVAADWRGTKHDIERAREIAILGLAELERGDENAFSTLVQELKGFALGRGLTLLLAIAVGTGVWLALRLVKRLFGGRWTRRDGRHPVRLRVALYLYQLLAALIVILAVLAVFYIREDILLLALTIIFLVAIALGARQFLPRYVAESRLLLNVGTVREGERVLYGGVPLKVESLNVYSELVNPELEGVVRLPLSALESRVSRPCVDEPWFPSRPGEFVMLSNGNVVQVVQQTVEFVRYLRLGSEVQMATAAYIADGPRNLSREGFGVATTFGIDYRHQSIALDTVAGRLESEIESRFDEAGLREDVDSISVEFKEAAASSLDYLVYVTLKGGAASSYFAITRLIQQACVRACNAEGWEIPFSQLTVHQATD